MWPEKQELLELLWRKYPANVFKEIQISYEKVEGIQSVQKQASATKYVPPNIRGFGEDSSPSAAPPAQGPIPGLPPGYTSSKSQSAFKGRNNPRKKTPTTNANPKSLPVGIAASAAPDKDDEERKKASAIKRKLKDIRLLKEKLEKGEKLDNNQLKKIASEADLNKELAALKLSS